MPAVFDNIDLNIYSISVVLKHYGAEKCYRYPNDLKVVLDAELNNESISTYWAELSSKHYQGLLKQAQYYKINMKLNDWGYIQCLKNIAEEVYPDQRNEIHLLVWYMLVKSGYKVKAGIMENKVVLFFQSKNKIYNVPYFSDNG